MFQLDIKSMRAIMPKTTAIDSKQLGQGVLPCFIILCLVVASWVLYTQTDLFVFNNHPNA